MAAAERRGGGGGRRRRHGLQRRLVAGAVGRRRAGARQGRGRLGGLGPQRRRRLALSQPAVPRGAAALAADGRAARLSHRIPPRAGDLRPDRERSGRLSRHGRRGPAAGLLGRPTSIRGTVRELVPMASEANIGGVHLHYGGQANPQRTVQAYAWALQDLGGRIAQHTPVDRHRRRGRPRGRRCETRAAGSPATPWCRRRAADRHAAADGRACACRWATAAPR